MKKVLPCVAAVWAVVILSNCGHKAVGAGPDPDGGFADAHLPADAGPSTDAGPYDEFRVDTHNAGEHAHPDLAAFFDENFVVVWAADGPDGSGYGIFGRRYGPPGTPAELEFQVNTFTENDQSSPAVGASANGDFVILWTSHGQDGSGQGAYGRKYDDVGAPVGEPFRINDTTDSNQSAPAVTVAPDGAFFAVYTDDGLDGSGSGIFGRWFDVDMTPLSMGLQINTYTDGSQVRPTAAGFGRSTFLTAWESAHQDGSMGGIYGQVMTSVVSPLGLEFRFNTLTEGNQTQPAVAAWDEGFVAVWRDDGRDGQGEGIFARRLSVDGTPEGPPFPVADAAAGFASAWAPDVALAPDGTMVVSWCGAPPNGPDSDIFVRFFDPTGEPYGPAHPVNTHTAGDQRYPAVAVLGNGATVVVWEGPAPDNTYGVFARRFTPSAL